MPTFLSLAILHLLAEWLAVPLAAPRIAKNALHRLKTLKTLH
jgi:hypothetical protein